MKYVLAAIVILLVGGCVVRSVAGFMTRKVVEQAMEQQMGDKGRVNMNADGTMQMTTSEGTVSTGNKVPDGWPTDVAVYPGATVQYSASVNPADGKAGNALILLSKDDASAVVAYYKSSLASAGWTSAQTMAAGGTTILSMTKDGRTLTVAVAAADGETTVTLGIQDKGE